MATSGDDNEEGDDLANKIDLLGGNDFANGFGGADTIRGGTGDDTILGGAGNDSIAGDSGNDKLSGEDGNDTLLGGAGEDELEGGNGDDRIDAGDQDDLVNGGGGADSVLGGAGNDLLRGDAGNDTLIGGTGDDGLEGGEGNDRIAGEDGDDEIFDNSGLNTLLGGGGNDYIEGGDGADSIDGGSGNDTLIGGPGADTLIGQAGEDLLDGGEGIDTAVFSKKMAEVKASFDGFSFLIGLSTTETDEVIDIEQFAFLDRKLSASQFAVERGLANHVLQVVRDNKGYFTEDLLRLDEADSTSSIWVMRFNGIWNESFKKRASDWLGYLKQQFPRDPNIQSLNVEKILDYLDQSQQLATGDPNKQQAMSLAGSIADVQLHWDGPMFDQSFGPTAMSGWIIQSTGSEYELLWSAALDFSIQNRQTMIVQANGSWNPQFVEQTAKAIKWLGSYVNPGFATWSASQGLDTIQAQLSKARASKETPDDLVSLVGQIADADFSISSANLARDLFFS